MRLLPSLCGTYPYPNLNKIVLCEWLSAASTYKKSILEEIKSDENFRKYSWNEDQDLSHRIFKKHPGSLFLTPYAKYSHEGSSALARARRGGFPNAEWVCEREVSLPLYPKMSTKDVYDVIQAVRSILNAS